MNNVAIAILAATVVVTSALFVWSKWRTLSPLRVGDRISLSGGYDDPPAWLGGRDAIDGTVLGFIETEDRRAALVQLDTSISFDDQQLSNLVLLYLRYENRRWGARGIVHLELWRNVPPSRIGKDTSVSDRRWIESHASYRVIGSAPGHV